MASQRMLPALAAVLLAPPVACQTVSSPFVEPIEAEQGLIVVGFGAFAVIPESDGEAPRPMLMVDEPGTGRFFVNDMRGPLHAVTYDGTVTPYLDIDDPRWGFPVEDSGRERGFQSFALHPQFAETGTPGYGKLYTWADTRNTEPRPDFTPGGGNDTHDTVLLEWTAASAGAATYDGGPPREILRLEQPFGNHNGGMIAFSPVASSPDDADYGMLYVGVADGGSGGDPFGMAQDLSSPFGKILRIDPLGSDGGNGRYGVPADNPWADDGDAGTLGEIFVRGVRNPQRFGWDPATGNLFVADIGQNSVEELSLAWSGADLGWNDWEGSFRFQRPGALDPSDPRSDPQVSFPVAEYDHDDPLLIGRAAVTGVVVYRGDAIPQLRDRVLFGDFPSGEILHISADDDPNGDRRTIHRVLLRDADALRTFLQVIRASAAEQGRPSVERADLRFATSHDGRVFLLNKHDGVIREVIP
jgi:hypothetical protein